MDVESGGVVVVVVCGPRKSSSSSQRGGEAGKAVPTWNCGLLQLGGIIASPTTPLCLGSKHQTCICVFYYDYFPPASVRTPLLQQTYMASGMEGVSFTADTPCSQCSSSCGMNTLET